jgi:hypothetical protein
MLNYLMKIFGSLRFTVGIVAALVVIFIIGMIVPQQPMIGQEAFLRWKHGNPGLVMFLQTLSLTDIFSAPYLLVLWGLFFGNLVAVMIKRIPIIWKRSINVELPLEVLSLGSYNHSVDLEGKGLHDVSMVLPRLGYKVFREESAFCAVKNRYAPLATILFHVSFLLLLVGGVMTFYTRFRGEAAVGVGETFTGEYTKIKRPKIGSVPDVSFKVEKITPTYFNRAVPVNLEVVISSRKGQGTYSINRPYKEGSLSFVIMDIDVAPLFILQDSTGKELDSAYVKLKVLQGKEDSFTMGGYTFKTVFYPDYLADAKSGISGGGNLPEALKQLPGSLQEQGRREIVNPAFSMAVFKGDTLVAKELVRPGESIRVGDASLVFADMDYWARFYAGMEHGLFIVYAGFGLLITALSLRLLCYRRELLGVVSDGKLHLAGRAEFYPTFFADEFQKVTKALEGDPEP